MWVLLRGLGRMSGARGWMRMRSLLSLRQRPGEDRKPMSER